MTSTHGCCQSERSGAPMIQPGSRGRKELIPLVLGSTKTILAGQSGHYLNLPNGRSALKAAGKEWCQVVHDLHQRLISRR